MQILMLQDAAFDSALERGGLLPQADIAQSNVGYYRTREVRVLRLALQIAAVRTSRRRRSCNFLPQRPVALSLGKFMLSLAVEPRFIAIDC